MNVTRLKIPAIRAAIESHVWAIHPDKLHAILELVELRAAGGTFTADEVVARIGERPKALTRVQGAVAVLPLHGVISARMNLMSEISGGTSAEMFGKEFDALLANQDVGAIVLDVDSPGGSVEGTLEVASKVFGARGTKPIVAVANGQMCSAAYWIASAAADLIATPSAVDIGNIGVYTVRRDLTAADEKDGFKYHIIGAGKYKAEGNPHVPMTDEEHEFTKGKVDEFYSAFVNAVAKHRGVSAKDVRSGYGEGRALTARQAKDAGLIDRIATLDDVIGKLVGTTGKRASSTRAETDAPLTLVASLPTDTTTGIQASGSASPTSALTPTQAPKARMVTMPDNGTAAEGAAPQDLAAVREAIRAEESKRVRDITALCTENRVSTEQTQTYVNSRMTVTEVGFDILKAKRTQSAVSGDSQPTRVTSVIQRSDADPRKGFASHRDFLLSVIKNRTARDKDAIKDEKLRPLAVFDANDAQAEGEMAYMLPTGFTAEGLRAAVGSDEQGNYANPFGGFLGNTVSRWGGVMETGFEGDPTVGLTQSIPMSTTTVEIVARTDKNHTSSVSGGFTVARKAETAAATASRQTMEKVSLRASSLFGLAYATEELLADSPISFAAIIDSGFRSQFGAHLLNEKIRGLGDGEFLGVLNAPCTVEQAKETGQSADTIVTQNLLKMRSRCWGYGSAVWLANHDTLPQLGVLSVGVGTAGALVYQTSVREDLPDRLLGRPIYFTEYASALGDVGDIMLVNLSQYLEGIYQPLQSAESIHVRFVNHERAFKLWMRNAGQPWWRSALTPAKSAVTLSPFVTLAAR